MNQAGRDALRQAALDGVRQIFGFLRIGDGRCALGVLEDAHPGCNLEAYYPYDMQRHVAACPLCGEKNPGADTWTPSTEAHLVTHLNDVHRLDFLGIAEKMPATD